MKEFDHTILKTAETGVSSRTRDYLGRHECVQKCVNSPTSRKWGFKVKCDSDTITTPLREEGNSASVLRTELEPWTPQAQHNRLSLCSLLLSSHYVVVSVFGFLIVEVDTWLYV